MRITFTPVVSPHDGMAQVDSGALKQAVSQDFKEKELIGVPDVALKIHYSPEDGNDILIEKIDPEKALGFRLFKSEDDYYTQLRIDQFSEADVQVAPEVADG